MKRMMAWMVAFCLIATCILPVRAAETSGTDLFGTTQNNADADSQQNENNQETRTQGEEDRMAGTSPSVWNLPEGNGQENNGESDSGPKEGAQATAETGPQPSALATPMATPMATPQAVTEATPETTPMASASATPGVMTSSTPEVMTSATPMATSSAAPMMTPSASPSATPTASPMATPLSAVDGSWNDRQVSGDVRGGIEVILMNALPIDEGSRITLTVTLENEDEREVVLERNAQKHLVSFDDLLPGTYHLKISENESSQPGFGFLTYEQDIEIKGEIRTAEIYTGFVELDGVAYTKDAPHPGVMLIGDVNRDGKIDASDKDAIMEAISRGTNGALAGEPAQNLTDLNKDGKTDLVDLQYYTNSRARMNEGADTAASLCSRVSPGAVQVNVNTGSTQIIGDVADLLKDNDSLVRLKSIDGSDISETSPVEIGFNLTSEDGQSQSVEQITVAMGENAIESGVLMVTTADESDPVQLEIRDGRVEAKSRMMAARKEEQEGVLTIDLGGQTAVKKVTLVITGLKHGGNLAEISKVEFLNDLESRIPAPTMNIPDGLTLTGANKSFEVTWNGQVNVTGYEVKISYEGQSEIRRAASNHLEVKSFLGGRLKNGEIYEVSVQSVNGTWVSGFCPSSTVSPVISGKPDAPDNLKATGGRRRGLQSDYGRDSESPCDFRP